MSSSKALKNMILTESHKSQKMERIISVHHVSHSAFVHPLSCIWLCWSTLINHCRCYQHELNW